MWVAVLRVEIGQHRRHNARIDARRGVVVHVDDLVRVGGHWLLCRVAEFARIRPMLRGPNSCEFGYCGNSILAKQRPDGDFRPAFELVEPSENFGNWREASFKDIGLAWP